MAYEIVAQLIETNQFVPDFLENYRPQPEDDEQAVESGDDLMDQGYAANEQSFNAPPQTSRQGDALSLIHI